MDDRKAVIAITVVAVVAIVALAAVYVSNSGKDDGEDIYTLYVGMNDSITHEDYDPEYATAVVDAIVMKNVGGFTRYNASGGWSYEDGSAGYENSLVYIIQGIDMKVAHKICDEVKSALNQEAVLITVTKEKLEYY